MLRLEMELIDNRLMSVMEDLPLFQEMYAFEFDCVEKVDDRR